MSSSSSSSSSSAGIGVFGLITVVLLVFKLAGIAGASWGLANLSWWLVFAPVLAGTVLSIIFIAIIVGFAFWSER